MNIGSGDYYSVSNRGYLKHPNVEVIGIETYPNPKSHPTPNHSNDREFEDKSVIKEEDMEYDQLQSRNSQELPSASLLPPFNKGRHMMEKEEVNSVHLATPKYSNEPQNLTHSCIANVHPSKGILKRSLLELQKKNISSQQDFTCDKQLYLQLEKERRLRRDLERTYKNILSEMQRKERSYSADLNNEDREDSGRKRQFSKRTLNHEKSHDGLISYQELEPLKHKSSDIKTVKLKEPEKCKESEESEEEAASKHEDQASEESQSEYSDEYRKHLTQQSGESESDYFRDQKEFQHKVISHLRSLNKRMSLIDQFLLEKEREQEKERLNQVIQEKERQIRRVELQNAQLRLRRSDHAEQQSRAGKEFDILRKVSPTSLYFFLLLIMAIVAMS